MCAYWGRMLKDIRKDRGFSQKNVCEGLCSLSQLTRIEKGELEPKKWLSDALMERLGIDPLLFGCIYSNSDEALHLNKLECLKAESGSIEETCPTDTQFNRLIEAFSFDLNTVTVDGMTELLKLTHPVFSFDEIENYLYTKEEVVILLIAIGHMFNSGRAALAEDYTGRLVLTLESQFMGSYSNIFQFSCAVLLDYLKIFNVKNAGWIADKLYESMHKSGRLYGFESANDYKNLYEEDSEFDRAVKAVYSQSCEEDCLWRLGTVDYMKQILTPRFIGYSEGAYLKSIRNQNCLTQDGMRSFGLTPRTVNRIENKKSDFQPKNYMELCETLGFEKTRFIPYIVTDSYSACTLYISLRNALESKDFVHAKALFASLRNKLDLSIRINKRRVAFINALIMLGETPEAAGDMLEIISKFILRRDSMGKHHLKIAESIDPEEYITYIGCLINENKFLDAEKLLENMIENSKDIAKIELASKEMLCKYYFQLIYVKNALGKNEEAKELYSKIYKKAIATDNLSLIKTSQETVKMLLKTRGTA